MDVGTPLWRFQEKLSRSKLKTSTNEANITQNNPGWAPCNAIGVKSKTAPTTTTSAQRRRCSSWPNYTSQWAWPTPTENARSWAPRASRTQPLDGSCSRSKGDKCAEEVCHSNKVEPIHLPKDPNTLRMDMAETVSLKPNKPKHLGTWLTKHRIRELRAQKGPKARLRSKHTSAAHHETTPKNTTGEET